MATIDKIATLKMILKSDNPNSEVVQDL